MAHLTDDVGLFTYQLESNALCRVLAIRSIDEGSGEQAPTRAMV